MSDLAARINALLADYDAEVGNPDLERPPGVGQMAALLRESAEALKAEDYWKAEYLYLEFCALNRAHEVLDRLGIPSATGAICDRSDCNSTLYHRMHVLETQVQKMKETLHL